MHPRADGQGEQGMQPCFFAAVRKALVPDSFKKSISRSSGRAFTTLAHGLDAISLRFTAGRKALPSSVPAILRVHALSPLRSIAE